MILATTTGVNRTPGCLKAPGVRYTLAAMSNSPRRVGFAILVAALGYFVDIYDLILFSVVRTTSLQAIGVPADQLLPVGVRLINMQMGGMLIGGVLWGVLGDKRGRLSVLFGSILMYSLANIANGYVQTVEQYAWLRLIAGIGLAGELGAGITLVSEIMPAKSRGWGTTIVATVGILGAVVAALVSGWTNWRTAYFVGGGMGLGLLALRIGVAESGMFESVKQTSTVARGNLWALLTSRETRARYARVVLIGLPIWYVIGILVTLAPELGGAAGMTPRPNGGSAVMYAYIGLAIGDLASGGLSQIIGSRRRVVAFSLVLTALSVGIYFTLAHVSLTTFYFVCVLLGISVGYWAVFVTMAAEQFGTNVRATAATTAPNFVRGALVLLNVLFTMLRPSLGVRGSALAVGVIALAIAFAALRGLSETFGKNLDYTEQH
jgi:MFS transporter, putative metabolite:H+ symporter